MKTLVIGLGNPILGDDGAGWKAAEAVKSAIRDQLSVEVDCASLGGLSLMERMLGYQHVILVDSMESGQGPEGSVKVLPLIALTNPTKGHSASAHDTSLLTALQMARSMGADVPERVDVVAIESKNAIDFSEKLSPKIAAAVPLAARAVLELLKKE
ncbi:MAG: hydrogenase maturation protease [Chloroflexi bacterium]|nr:hydrogenase maturation protease [Chloroflexota bacterium]